MADRAFRTALVAGPSGATGAPLVAELSRQGWTVHGLSRRAAPGSPCLHRAADLLDPDACRRAVAAMPGLSHLFYAARAPHRESGVEDVGANLAMLSHVVEAAEAGSDALRHVHLIEGTKWYGVHLGPYRTPAREDDPRHMPPNFYYDQQDFLAARQRQGRGWDWSASRPNVVCDYAPGRGRNLVSIIGAYAAICRALQVPFDFPGTRAGYDTLTEVTDAAHLAGAICWMATEPAARNQAFNITNGDCFRWCTLWPSLAELCGVRCGEPRDLRLASWMADKAPVWAEITRHHGLQPRPLESVADWAFADFVFRQDWDVVSDLGRIRRAGFNACVDTTVMFAAQLHRYRTGSILPACG